MPDNLREYYKGIGVKQISIIYESIDGCNKVRHCETLAGARAWAMYWVGECPDLGSYYAVSADGIGKVMVNGCSIHDIFPPTAKYIFTIHTLDSHEHYGPFGSYKAAFDYAYNHCSSWQIEVQRLDKFEQGEEIYHG